MAITIDGDGTITGLSAGGLPDNSVQTADIADDQITLAKLAGGTDGQIITYDASGDPVAVGPGTDGQVLTSTGAGSPPAFETITSVDTNALAKAWINFNGTGTVAIRDHYNVSSLTDNGTGDYTINFTNNMPNTDYIVVGFVNNENSRACTLGSDSFTRNISPNRDAFAVGSARMPTTYMSGTNGDTNNLDPSQVYLVFFGG